MKKSKGFHTPKGGHHTNPKPRLRTRHLSSVGKSAYAGAGGAGAMPAFPPAGGAPGAPAFDPGAGGGDSAPLAGPGGAPPGM